MVAKTFRILLTCVCLFHLFYASAQDSVTAHFDPSKPTNVYDRLSNNLEYNFLKNGSRTFGYRASLVLASRDQKNSVNIELPLLYSTFSQKFGLGDIRLRYYWIPYKHYSRKPGAFGLLIDSYTPTGSLKDGLGRGRWIFAPGLSTAFVFGRFSTFPIVSYLYSSKIKDSKSSSNGAGELNGYTIQSICVYKFRKSYLDCTPIFMKNSYSNSGKDDFVLEGNYLYMVKPNKMQVGCFARRYFLGNSTTLRAALRLFL